MHHEDGVVELAEATETFDEATDLHVGVIEERCEGLLQTRGKQTLVVGKIGPCIHAGVAWRQHCVCRNHTALDLLVEPTLADDIPAFVVAAAVLGQILRWRLVRGVSCAERKVGKERAVGANTL